MLACVGAFILQLRRLRAAREAPAAMDDAPGDDVAAAVVLTAAAAANGAAQDAPVDEAPVLAPVPALTSAGEEPPAEAPEDAGADVAAAPAAATAAAPAVSPEKRRVEFGAEQSPAQRGRPGADGEREREPAAVQWMRDPRPAWGPESRSRGGWSGGRGGYSGYK